MLKLIPRRTRGQRRTARTELTRRSGNRKLVTWTPWPFSQLPSRSESLNQSPL